MEPYKIQIIETIVVIAGYIITHYITKIFVNNSLKQTHLQRGRRKMIIKAVHLLSFLTVIVLLSAIWGLKQNEIAVFVGTILTALGIAFFAQWSLLSNVTSSLLLFGSFIEPLSGVLPAGVIPDHPAAEVVFTMADKNTQMFQRFFAPGL